MSLIALFISSPAQLLQCGAKGLCCSNKLEHDIGSDTTKIIALIACSLSCQMDETEKLIRTPPTRFVICRCFTFWTRKPTYSRRGLASVHPAPDVAVSIMHSDSFKLKGLLCLCNAYTSVASARITHRTRILPESLRVSDQAPEVQVLRFTNVVWLHYRAARMHKIFGVSVNVIHNLMPRRIHCLFMIGSVLGNYFPLIVVIIIGNDQRLQRLNSLDRRGDRIRSWISESRTICDAR